MRFPILAQDLAASLRTSLRQADVDHAAFQRPLAVCHLATCKATCCHDGVVLDWEEARVLGCLASQHRDQLADYGIDMEKPLFARLANGRTKTATRVARPDECAADFPTHFPRTRCVFLDADHRCAWQRLAQDLGEAPWTFKPVSCWMHPVALLPEDRHQGTVPLLTVAGNPSDPQDFAAHTPCGRPCPAAPPASESLAGELRLLGEIAGRDFLEEMLGH